MTTIKESPGPAEFVIPNLQPHPEDNDLASVVAIAVELFTSVSGKRVESVAGGRVHDDRDGWTIQVEVVEMESIPASTSVLALYDIELDRNCRLVSFGRNRRYVRSMSDPP